MVRDFGNVSGDNVGHVSSVVSSDVVHIHGQFDTRAHDIGAVNNIEQEDAEFRRGKARPSSNTAGSHDAS